MIHASLLGRSLVEAVDAARTLLSAQPDSRETLNKIDQALTLASSGTAPTKALPSIGQGWVAEEALGVVIYCASVAPDFLSGVALAVNHDGDSDTTGSLVGQLLGARAGEAAIPAQLLDELELRDVIATVADDLATFRTWDLHGKDEERIWSRYPGW